MLSEHSTEHDEYLNLTICFLGRHIFCQTRVVLNVKTPALGRVRLRSALRRVSKCLAPSERPTVFVGRGNDVLRVVCVCVCVCACVRVCICLERRCFVCKRIELVLVHILPQRTARVVCVKSRSGPAHSKENLPRSEHQWHSQRPKSKYVLH